MTQVAYKKYKEQGQFSGSDFLILFLKVFESSISS